MLANYRTLNCTARKSYIFLNSTPLLLNPIAIILGIIVVNQFTPTALEERDPCSVTTFSYTNDNNVAVVGYTTDKFNGCEDGS